MQPYDSFLAPSPVDYILKMESCFNILTNFIFFSTTPWPRLTIFSNGKSNAERHGWGSLSFHSSLNNFHRNELRKFLSARYKWPACLHFTWEKYRTTKVYTLFYGNDVNAFLIHHKSRAYRNCKTGYSILRA